MGSSGRKGLYPVGSTPKPWRCGSGAAWKLGRLESSSLLNERELANQENISRKNANPAKALVVSGKVVGQWWVDGLC